MIVRELAAHRAGLDDRNLGLLGELAQRIPCLAVEHAGAGDDDRAFCFAEQGDGLGDMRRGRIRLGVGTVMRLVEVVDDVARLAEAGIGRFGREIQVDRAGTPVLSWRKA